MEAARVAGSSGDFTVVLDGAPQDVAGIPDYQATWGDWANTFECGDPDDADTPFGHFGLNDCEEYLSPDIREAPHAWGDECPHGVWSAYFYDDVNSADCEESP